MNVSLFKFGTNCEEKIRIGTPYVIHMLQGCSGES